MSALKDVIMKEEFRSVMAGCLHDRLLSSRLSIEVSDGRVRSECECGVIVSVE